MHKLHRWISCSDANRTISLLNAFEEVLVRVGSIGAGGGGGDLRAILAQIRSMSSSSQQHQRFKAHCWMMQPTTTSSRWGAVSSIALLCTPSSCVRLVNCEVSSIAKDVVLLKSAALGGPPTKWTTCSCACPSVAPFFRTGRTLHDCSSFLARGKCTWRRRTALQEVFENRVKKKKNTPGWLWVRERECVFRVGGLFQ